MKISDLDTETRRLVFAAHIAVKNPTDAAVDRLRKAVEAFDLKHERERSENLIRAIFDEPQKCTIPPAGWRCTLEAGHDGPCAAWPAEGCIPGSRIPWSDTRPIKQPQADPVPESPRLSRLNDLISAAQAEIDSSEGM
jgi:hypothetical protein